MVVSRKPPVTAAAGEVWEQLAELSKAALIDLYAQALAASLGRADEPVTLAHLRDDAGPVLELRGDRMPTSWGRA